MPGYVVMGTSSALSARYIPLAAYRRGVLASARIGGCDMKSRRFGERQRPLLRSDLDLPSLLGAQRQREP